MSTTADGAADCDVVVVGAGHNGLVCAAYLARAGLDVILVEARDSVGGCSSTVDALGARVNICNCDHLWVRTTAIVEELDLASHGLEYLDLDPAYAALGWDNEAAWLQYHSIERTLDGLALTHPHAVDGYRRYLGATMPAARALLDLVNRPPGAVALGAGAARRPRGSLGLARWARRSAAGLLARYFDDETMIRPALVVGPAVWGVDPTASGTGLAALGYAVKHLATVGRPRGGSGRFADAVAGSFAAAGGATLLGAPVHRLTVGDAGPATVHLVDGRTVTASRVVAACDPRTVFVEWLTTSTNPEPPEVQAARSAPDHDGYESKIDAVIAHPPRYPDLDTPTTFDSRAVHATVLVAPPIDEMRAAHARLGAGRVPERPLLITNTPSTLDDTLRTGEGHHVLSLEVLWTPAGLHGGWPHSAEPDRWIATWDTLTDGAAGDIVRRRVMSPPDYARDFALRNGHAPSFAGSPLSALVGRPRHLTRYRTSLRGLYLTGAATFPGAGIWGASGRNTAAVVAADAGIGRL